MAKLYNLAKMTVSGTPATGTITLGSAAVVNGVTFLSFTAAGVADGDVVDYSILDPTNGGSEGGTGTFTLAGTTLTRTVLRSTNSNTAINASSASIVSISPAAETLNNGSIARPANQQVFTSSGTWTKPTGFGAKAYVLIQCWGGGAGGAKNNAVSNIGGGGGGYKYRWILLSSLGATETVTIAAGGAAGTTSSTTAGGNTTFGSWVTAYGGGVSSTLGGGGGPYASGGYLGVLNADAVTVIYDSISGYDGGIGGNAANTLGGFSSVWGGGGGGNGGTTTAGTSQFAGNGGAGSSAGTAGAGTAPAGGGGATKTGTAGAGARGQVTVTVFDGA